MSVPSYSPAPRLLSHSLLTTSELISHFQDFHATLEYVSHAPILVFERLVLNLNGDINAALERERIQHATALEKCRDEIQNLQTLNSHLETELAEWKNRAMLRERAPEPQVLGNPVIGTFHTSEVRLTANPRGKTSKVIVFAKPYSVPPGLPIGLNFLDFSNLENIRVVTHARNVQKDRFDINMDSRDGTILHQGGCTWLEVESGDPDFQFGTFTSKHDHPQAHSICPILFPRTYSAPPRVVVWLTTLDIDHEKDWRVKTYETDITAAGFTIHIETWGNTELYPTIATWVSYPADRPNVFSGKFNTQDIRPSDRPQCYNNGYANFGSSIFTAPPRVLVAFNSLEISREHNLRVSVKTSNVSPAGMMWDIHSWSDTILYSAGASYIALGR